MSGCARSTRRICEEFNVLTESQMPSYEDLLTEEELADVLAYLVSLKG